MCREVSLLVDVSIGIEIHFGPENEFVIYGNGVLRVNLLLKQYCFHYTAFYFCYNICLNKFFKTMCY